MKVPKLLTLCKSAWLPCAATIVLLGAVSATAADYPTTILTDNPVAYYRLEELAGTTNVTDSSVNGLTGNIYFKNNATPVLGQLGLQTNSFHFDGTPGSGSSAGLAGTLDVPFRQYLSPTNVYGITSTNGSYLRAGPFSVECWTRSFTNRGDTSWEGIVSCVSGNNSGSSPTSGGWILGKHPTDFKWVFLMRGAKSGAGVYSVSAPVLMQWYHLVGTFDGTNSFFYVNGVLQGSLGEAVNTNCVAANYRNTACPLNIGNARYAASPWVGYNGDIDEVACYTNALTFDQVQTHYQAGLSALPLQAPVLVKDLVDTTNYANTPLTLSVTAGGTLPLAYQWYRNGAPINGATNSTLTYTTVYPADNGAAFSVSITNSLGSTNSATATVTLSTDLLAAPCPDGSFLQSITRNAGSYAAFRPVPYGAYPMSYQWFKNDVLLPGQTNATLWLTNVQTADNGTYSVQVSNPWNSTNMSASLYVQARPVSVPLTGYAARVAADHPVAYWRLDDFSYVYGTALDVVGSFDGTYTDASAGVFANQLTPGIPGETNAAVGLTNGAIVAIPYAAELNPDTTWSAETWVQVDPSLTIYTVMGSEYNHSSKVALDWTGWYLAHDTRFIVYLQPQNTIMAAGPDDPANGNQIVADKWYHVVVSRDAANFNLFINGKLRASCPVSTTPFTPNGSGVRPEDGIQGQGQTMLGWFHNKSRPAFAGLMDDTAFYNYALSSQQVLSHYLNANVQAPAASFTASSTSGIRPLTVNFQDTSSGQVDSLLWNFGDGATNTTAAGAAPSHTYTAEGVYSVSLTASGPGGSSTTNWANLVSVSLPPVPQVRSATMPGSGLVLSGAGGPTGSGNQYYVLSSTNLTLPLSAWERVATNLFNADGTFTCTNAAAGAPQRFYRLQMP